jgi:hypothetical protein
LCRAYNTCMARLSPPAIDSMSALSNTSWPPERTGGAAAHSLLHLADRIRSFEEPAPTTAFIDIIDIPTSLMMNPLRTVDKSESLVPVLEREFELKMKGGYVSGVHEGVFEPLRSTNARRSDIGPGTEAGHWLISSQIPEDHPVLASSPRGRPSAVISDVEAILSGSLFLPRSPVQARPRSGSHSMGGHRRCTHL